MVAEYLEKRKELRELCKKFNYDFHELTKRISLTYHIKQTNKKIPYNILPEYSNIYNVNSWTRVQYNELHTLANGNYIRQWHYGSTSPIMTLNLFESDVKDEFVNSAQQSFKDPFTFELLNMFDVIIYWSVVSGATVLKNTIVN